jgi:hypothetical protein
MFGDAKGFEIRVKTRELNCQISQIKKYGRLTYILLPALAVSSVRELRGSNHVNSPQRSTIRQRMTSSAYLDSQYTPSGCQMEWLWLAGGVFGHQISFSPEHLSLRKIRRRAIGREVGKLGGIDISLSSALKPMFGDIYMCTSDDITC